MPVGSWVHTRTSWVNPSVMRGEVERGYANMTASPPPQGYVADFSGINRTTFPGRPRRGFPTPSMTADTQRHFGDRHAWWGEDAGGKGDPSRLERGPGDWVRPQPRGPRDVGTAWGWGEYPQYEQIRKGTVSYTHLTLPTKRIV